jgi:hypothetical protein
LKAPRIPGGEVPYRFGAGQSLTVFDLHEKSRMSVMALIGLPDYARECGECK